MLNKSHCTFALLNTRKADIFFNPIFIPCFSGSTFFWVRVQVLEVAIKLIVALNFSILRHIYVYNFSSSSNISIRKCTHQTYFHLKVFIYVMIFVFREVFLRHNNFLFETQKISYWKITYQSRKQHSFFI